MSRRRQSSLLALGATVVVTLAIAAVIAPPGHTDGDPCSDVLLNVDVCLPVAPTAPPFSTLVQHVALVNHGGYRVKVAIIASKDDLGAVPSMWGRPTDYAPFLGKELRMLFHGNLLVVMPAGIGFYHDGRPVDSEQAALARVAVGASDAPGLARAALTAVDAVAAASGVPVVLMKHASLVRRRLTVVFGVIGSRAARSVVVRLVVRRRGAVIAKRTAAFSSIQAATQQALVVNRPTGWGRGVLQACVSVSIRARPSPSTCVVVGR